jgi:hypothetical protein
VLLAGQLQILQPKRDLVEHVAAHDLPLRVLEQGADRLGEIGHLQRAGITPEEGDLAVELAPVAARYQSVDATHQRRLAAATGPGDEQQLAPVKIKGQVADRRLLPDMVAERQVLNRERDRFRVQVHRRLLIARFATMI